jgi:uncharacterized protein involved in type VI secretion and phage assembly
MTTQPYIRFEAGPASDPLVKACVTKLNGHESINGLYRFELDLELIEEKQGAAFTRDCADINVDRLLLNNARAIWIEPGAAGQTAERPLHGIVESFEILGFNGKQPLCRVVLRPRLWKLTRNRRSRVFLNKSVKDVIESLMADAGLASGDYRFSGTQSTASREYITQYDETDFAFLSRWMEHEGLYFYIEQDNTGTGDARHEVVVICGEGASQENSRAGVIAYEAVSDSLAADVDNKRRPPPANLSQSQLAAPVLGVQNQPSVPALEFGEEEWLAQEHVRGISLAQGAPIREIVLNEYDWKNPTSSLMCTEQVASSGNGTLEEIDNQYTTSSDGARLARIRKQEVLAREKIFNIATNCRRIEVGLKQEVRNHARSAFNTFYFVTEVNHFASQRVDAAGNSFGASYRNTIIAIPSDPQNRPYRPSRVTPWPKVSGVVRATVQSAAKSGTPSPFGIPSVDWDAEMSPDIDDDGNYVVQLGYDREGRPNGQASNRIRMAQPFAGAYKGTPMGIHFPLRAATEVILTHVNGNPDRPVIAGALPNRAGDPASVSYARRQSANIIRTQGDNRMIMKDSKYARLLALRAGNSRSRLKMANFGLHELGEIDAMPGEGAAALSTILSANTTDLTGDLVTCTGFYDFTAEAASCSINAGENWRMIAGFPAILNTLRLIKLAFLHADDWIMLGMEDAGVSSSIESAVLGVKTVAMTLVKFLIVKKCIKDTMKKTALTKFFPKTRERMMLRATRIVAASGKDAAKTAKALAKLAALPAAIASELGPVQFFVDPTESLLMYGVRIQRSPKGSIVEGTRMGENMLIATELGAIDINAGDNVHIVSGTNVDVEAEEGVSLTGAGGGVEVGADKTRMVSKNWLSKVELTDDEVFLVNAKAGRQHHVTLSKDGFNAYGGDIHLASTDGKSEVMLLKGGKARIESQSTVVEVKCGNNFVSVSPTAINIVSAAKIKVSSMGPLEIESKASLDISAPTVNIGGASINIKGSAVAIDGATIMIGGQAFTAMGSPTPPVPKPVIPVPPTPPAPPNLPMTPPPVSIVDETGYAAVVTQLKQVLAARLRTIEAVPPLQ